MEKPDLYLPGFHSELHNFQ